jgi:hypothetical protein
MATNAELRHVTASACERSSACARLASLAFCHPMKAGRRLSPLSQAQKYLRRSGRHG